MIHKPRTIPIYLQKLQALERRLPQVHPLRSDVEGDLAKWRAGYKGEQSIDYHLSFLLDNDCHILHDLRLHDGSHYFQMDTVLLTPSLLILLEIKNIAGTLILDSDFHQFIRKDGDKEEAFLHPIVQSERHKVQLEMWLEQKGFPPVPIEPLVVMANNRAVLKRSGTSAAMYDNVIPSFQLPDKIGLLLQKYPDSLLAFPVVKDLLRQLTLHHTNSAQNPLRRYHISPSELVTGVFCPKCAEPAMQRKHGFWHCSTCQRKDRHAHRQALREYALLINPQISNQQAAAFMRLPSSHTVKRLLQSLPYPVIGTGRATRYHIIEE